MDGFGMGRGAPCMAWQFLTLGLTLILIWALRSRARHIMTVALRIILSEGTDTDAALKALVASRHAGNEYPNEKL